MGSNLVPEQRLDKNGKVVTRHVRQEAHGGDKKVLPSPAPAITKSATQIDAEVVAEALYAGSLIPVEEHLPLDEVTPWLIQLFPAKTLATGAELFSDPTGNRSLNEWMMRKLLELAEDAYTEACISERIQEEIPRNIVRVEQARVIAASNLSDAQSKTIRRVLNSVKYQSNTAIQRVVREGSGVGVPYDESYFIRANVSLLTLNLISSALATEVVDSTALEIHKNLERVYTELDRILPHLQEFQSRETFSFEILHEMEASPSKAMMHGAL